MSYLFIAIIWINYHCLMRVVGPPMQASVRTVGVTSVTGFRWTR
jgi:hypothetical protein